jgi:hypothetical protein
MIHARSADGTFNWDFESDLSTLACHAATELDNFIIGREEEPEAIERLVGYIADQTTLCRRSRFLLPPSFAVIVNRTLARISGHGFSTVSQLKVELDKYIRMLEKVVCNHQDVLQEDLIILHDFCLALSDYASAQEYPTRHFLVEVPA